MAELDGSKCAEEVEEVEDAVAAMPCPGNDVGVDSRDSERGSLSSVQNSDKGSVILLKPEQNMYDLSACSTHRLSCSIWRGGSERPVGRVQPRGAPSRIRPPEIIFLNISSSIHTL